VPDSLGLTTVDGDLVAAYDDLHVVESVLDQAEQLVALAEKADHQMVVWDEDLYLGRRHGQSHPKVPARVTASAGRPTHLASPQHVQVEVGHGILRMVADVEDESEAAFGEALVRGDLLGGEKKVHEL
jgi:hypothetical protein